MRRGIRKNIKTGTLQFQYPDGEVDFPGIYIEGCKAATFRHYLLKVIRMLDDDTNRENLEILAELLGEGIIQTYKPEKMTTINFRDWAIFYPE